MEPSEELEPSFSISWETNAVGTPVLIAQGELDLAAAPSLRGNLRTIIEMGAEMVVLDLEGVSFLDSAALAALIEARTLTDVRLRAPSAVVVSLLDLTGLTEQFPLES